MDRSLEATLEAAAGGDESAWRRLVEAYSGRVYGLLYRQCGDAELAEEIAQATFVKVARKLGGYREHGRFEPWLFRIAMNQLRDEMRRRKRQAPAIDFAETPPESIGYAGDADRASPDRPAVEAERDAKLHAALAELPEADQRVLHMRYTAELSYAQIAEALDQPLGTVLARGHRALKKLRQALDGGIDET
jgi:RNA polymerase sigma-70 factor (ECF subfamily)